ncbi:MAG: hypothetical protein U0176_07245 [Bacteroidia bacterium]
MKRNLLFAALFGVASFLILPGCGGEKAKEGDAKTTESGTTGDSKVDAAGDPNAGKYDPSGTYTLSKDDGTEATLTVKKSGQTYSYSLSAHVGNAAEMERSANMSLVADQEYEDNDDACIISFQFDKDGCRLSYISSFEGCGEVDCAGNYVREL